MKQPDEILIELAPGEYWPGPNATDLARLEYLDPETGEEYPYAVYCGDPNYWGLR